MPRPPDLARHVLRELPLDEVFAHVNRADAARQAPRRARLGAAAARRRRRGASELAAASRRSRTPPWRRGWLRAGGRVPLLPGPASRRRASCSLDPAGRELAVAPLPAPGRARRTSGPPTGSPHDAAAGDCVAMFVVTAGAGVRERAQPRCGTRPSCWTASPCRRWPSRPPRRRPSGCTAGCATLWGFPDPPR